ncbi:MAG: YraN family protein [Williamsia sp.]|nr:YraN family protein [Williamsia sp.]
MSWHIQLGKRGEQLAKAYLTEKGFLILSVNWKYSRYEIDLIASKEEVLHFIEVKTRSNERFGLPEESVDKQKMRRLMKAADQYLYLHPGWKWVQYDVLAITIRGNQAPRFFVIEDVYPD